MPETFSIFTDSYRKQCKTYRKQDNGIWTSEGLLPENYDLSWVNHSFFWRQLHHEANRLENQSTILTNSHFLYECLSANILMVSDFPKKFKTVAPNTNEENFQNNLDALEKFLKKSTPVSVKKIPVHISSQIRPIWRNFMQAFAPHFQSLFLEFEETDDMELAEFFVIHMDEEPQYSCRQHPLCFALSVSEDGKCISDVIPSKFDKGVIWSLNTDNLMPLLRFFDFFYRKPRFIELARHCIREAQLETLEEAQELISLWCSRDWELPEEVKEEDHLYLLVDNSEIKDVQLTQSAVFPLRIFQNNVWNDKDNIGITTYVPPDYVVGKIYDSNANVKQLYRENYHAEAKDVFVFTPEKRLLSTLPSDPNSDSGSTNVRLKFRVIADGSTDKFGIRSSGQIASDGAFIHPLGSTLKFNVWVDNRREYDEQLHPLSCTLDNVKISPLGPPVRSSSEVLYTFEIVFSEVKKYSFKAQMEGISAVAQCVFTILPYPDTVLGRLKPMQKKQRQELISVEHGPAVVDFCKAPIKKIVCFPGVTFELNQAVFNKSHYTPVDTEERLFQRGAPCYDSSFNWKVIDSSPNACELKNGQFTVLKGGHATLRLESCWNKDLHHDITFEIRTDKSAIMTKLLWAGLAVSLLSSFWYGAGFWALLCKLFCPLLVYYAGTHTEECLKTPKHKVLFWTALIFSFFVLLRGLWQEI